MLNRIALVSTLLTAGVAACAPAPPPGPPIPLDVACAPVFNGPSGAPRKLELRNISTVELPRGMRYDVTLEPQRISGGPFARIELAEAVPPGHTYITRTAFSGHVIGCTAKVVFLDTGDDRGGVP